MDDEWWAGACEEDTVAFWDEAVWARSGFLPPPPRPLHLDPSPNPDGLTTCDLCSWATSAHQHPDVWGLAGEVVSWLVPWPITLVVVSLLSALLGAALMLTLRRCLKKLNAERVSRLSESEGRGHEVDKAGPVVARGNHYTVEEEGLYAELDRPAYQNTGYAASPPSSAYYSDLSERTYETVGHQQWEMMPPIAETIPPPPQPTLHSDYV